MQTIACTREAFSRVPEAEIKAVHARCCLAAHEALQAEHCVQQLGWTKLVARMVDICFRHSRENTSARAEFTPAPAPGLLHQLKLPAPGVAAQQTRHPTLWPEIKIRIILGSASTLYLARMIMVNRNTIALSSTGLKHERVLHSAMQDSQWFKHIAACL